MRVKFFFHQGNSLEGNIPGDFLFPRTNFMAVETDGGSVYVNLRWVTRFVVVDASDE